MPLKRVHQVLYDEQVDQKYNQFFQHHYLKYDHDT